jgi:hypothetical protein
MKKPLAPWPFTGRLHTEGAELQVIHVHEKWVDLVWVDIKRDNQVYLSTLPFDKYQKDDSI